MGRIDRLRAAVATAEESFGPDDHRTLAARLALGRGFYEVPNEAEAYAELAALADDCTRVLGPEHADTLIAQYEAGMACLGLHTFQRHPDPQRLPEAIGRLEKVAADRERLHGPTHPDTLRTWRNLAHAYSTAERYTESRPLNERILAGWKQLVTDRKRELGPDAPGTQTARMGLAGCLGFQEGRVLEQQVAESRGRLVAERIATLGPVHPDTVDERVRHAYTVFDPAEKARVLEGIAADLLDAFGPADPRTLNAQVDLAFCYYLSTRDLTAASDLAGRIINEIRRVLGPEHDYFRRARAVLIGVHQANGRTEDADAVTARYPIPDDEDEDGGMRAH
ncbi:tetratricopeptide repeat protein [Actinoplanes xinjiangensis]|uniref:Tetratricopeptide repeat protein n=1 Tax=Actinoplanes xinjiangensis TaxID=512350 RepID=A0A316FEB7_9ACTN|nr:tetratricopeptide repeat protein [Actinoplanes xinjiangensis]PWK47251.1 tetratricopeptide repeat protein [Actinoplanes xinjiangensis]GIF40412.1 hypothetical protein Axi01nite_47230 [Actinoplanes xinjiangensis]